LNTSNVLEAASIYLKNKAQQALTKSTLGQVIANNALLASMPPLLAASLVLVGALAAIAAIAFVVVRAV
jgi:hypothetical protein